MPRGTRTVMTRVATDWYCEVIERMVRARVDKTKQRIIAYLETHKMVPSFTGLYETRYASSAKRVIAGRRGDVLLAWQELLRSGEVVDTRVGYCLKGAHKKVVEMIAQGSYFKKMRGGVGEQIRRNYRKQASTMMTELEARQLEEKKAAARAALASMRAARGGGNASE